VKKIIEINYFLRILLGILANPDTDNSIKGMYALTVQILEK